MYHDWAVILSGVITFQFGIWYERRRANKAKKLQFSYDCPVRGCRFHAAANRMMGLNKVIVHHEAQHLEE